MGDDSTSSDCSDPNSTPRDAWDILRTVRHRRIPRSGPISGVIFRRSKEERQQLARHYPDLVSEQPVVAALESGEK